MVNRGELTFDSPATPTRPNPALPTGWPVNYSAWALPLLCLALLAVISVMFFNQPKPLVVVFDELNSGLYQQSGFYGSEKDETGTRYRWTNGKAVAIVPLRSRHPVTLTISARNAAVANGPKEPTLVLANGRPVGQIEPQVEGIRFFTTSLQFVPFTDEETWFDFVRIELSTPSFQPASDNRRLGVMIETIRLDAARSLEPYTRRAAGLEQGLLAGLCLLAAGIAVWNRRAAAWLLLPAGWLILQVLYFRAGLLPALGVFLVFSLLAGWLFRRKRAVVHERLVGARLAWLATVVTGSLLAIRVLLLGMAGYPGPHEQFGPPFWLFLAGNSALALSCAGLAGFYFPLQPNRNLWQILGGLLRPAIAAKPGRWIGLYFFLVNLVLTAIIWAQQLLVYGSLDLMARHWDGPRYLINAVSLYNPNHPILELPSYSKAFWMLAFPGFAVIVRALSYPLGYLPALLSANLIITPLWAWVMYRLLKDFNYCRWPLWVVTIALVLPVRWLSVHAIGSSEPLALLGGTAALYFFQKERWALAGLAGALAMTARPTSILLYAGLLAALAFQAFQSWQLGPDSSWRALFGRFQWRAALWLSLIPVMLLLIYAFYGWRNQDALAYFHIPEGQLKDISTSYFPFTTLLSGTGGLGQIYIFLLPLIGLSLLWRQERYDIFWTGLLLFLPNIFVSHADLARYLLPVLPFLVIVPFARWLEWREVRPALLLACLLIYFNTFYDMSQSLANYEVWQKLKSFT